MKQTIVIGMLSSMPKIVQSSKSNRELTIESINDLHTSVIIKCATLSTNHVLSKLLFCWL